jgi:uncharacterized protein YlzI (FlbEa/FlbD family)
MRLISFNCDNEEHLVNPEKIKWMRARASGDTLITFDDDSEMVVEHCLREVGARINNQELNVAYDCLNEIERLKHRIKQLSRTTAPAEL